MALSPAHNRLKEQSRHPRSSTRWRQSGSRSNPHPAHKVWGLRRAQPWAPVLKPHLPQTLSTCRLPFPPDAIWDLVHRSCLPVVLELWPPPQLLWAEPNLAPLCHLCSRGKICSPNLLNFPCFPNMLGGWCVPPSLPLLPLSPHISLTEGWMKSPESGVNALISPFSIRPPSYITTSKLRQLSGCPSWRPEALEHSGPLRRLLPPLQKLPTPDLSLQGSSPAPPPAHV